MVARLVAVAAVLSSGVLSGGEAAALYFTPNPRTDKVIEAVISSARMYVYAASYSFSWEEAARALAGRVSAGADVRLLLDRPAGRPLPPGLAARVRLEEGPGLFHAKMIVVDDRTLVIPSANLTEEGLRRDHNSVLVVEDPEAARFCRERFLAWWEGRRETAPFRGRGLDLFFAPGPDCAARVEELLRSARSSIRFVQYAFTSEETAVVAARRRMAGCRVWGIMDPTTGSAVPAYALLSDLGCEMRRSNRAGLLHDKTAVVDDRIVVTGSYNLSRAAERNVECLAVIADRNVAAEAVREFRRLWRWQALP